MSYGNELIAMLRPLGVYSFREGSFSLAELQALGAVLDEADTTFSEAQKETIVLSAGDEGLSPNQRRQLYARGAQPVLVRVRRCVQCGRDRGGQPCEGLVPGCDGHSGGVLADENYHRGHSAVSAGNYILVSVLHMAGDGGLRSHMGRFGRDDVARVRDVSRGLEEKKGGRDAPRAVRPFLEFWRALRRKVRCFC